jgi:hypothetical protein
MTKKNHTIIHIEEGVPGCPRINHLSIHKACDRFLGKRGLPTHSFRRSEFLFGRMAIGQQRRAAA